MRRHFIDGCSWLGDFKTYNIESLLSINPQPVTFPYCTYKIIFVSLIRLLGTYVNR